MGHRVNWGGRARRLLTASCLLAASGALFLHDQQNRIQPETLEVCSPRLPAAFDGFRIVQVSDLHGKQFGAGNKTLLRAVAAQAPDVIAVTGDWIDHKRQLAAIPALARALSSIAPVYYVTGNHEWATGKARLLKAMLRQNGVIPLSNEYAVLERNGARIVLAGADDPNGPTGQKTPMALTEEIRAALGDPFVILLAHRNESYRLYDRCGVDLALSGHAHGGVIRLPFTDGLISNTGGFFFPNHTAGAYPLEHGGTQVVSRGLGNGGAGFRLFNRPHLPVILLRAVSGA